MKIIASIFLLLIGISFVKPKKLDKPYYAGVTIRQSIMSEYVHMDLYSDSVIYAYQFTGTVAWRPYSFGGRKITMGAPGFNQIAALDDQGYPWTADLGSTNGTRVSTDTFGNAFNYNGKIYGYFFSYFTISKDSTIISTWGTGSYNWFATPIVKPYPLHAPAGKKWVKLSGGNDLVGLTSTGEVWVWPNGDTNAVQKTLPAGSYATDIAASHNAFFLCNVHDYAGGNAQNGHLYWWGSQPGFIGDNNSRTQPTVLTSIFRDSVGNALPYTVKSVVCNDNTVHFIDSANNCWGEGDGAQAEVGQGRDTVIKYQYSNQYAWTTLKGEGYTNGRCYIVVPNCKELFTGTSFTFYCMVKDMNDSLVFWGRNKSFVLPTSYVSNTESTKPNALDVVRPVVGSGFQHPNGVSVNFVAPTMSAGNDRTVTTNNPTLSVSGSPTQMGGYGYAFGSYQWSQVSGPSATINSPTSSSTTVTMTTAGAYRFRMTTTDTQTATDTASVLITYSPPAGGCGGCTVLKNTRKFIRI